jgi:hypothetical protein
LARGVGGLKSGGLYRLDCQEDQRQHDERIGGASGQGCQMGAAHAERTRLGRGAAGRPALS